MASQEFDSLVEALQNIHKGNLSALYFRQYNLINESFDCFVERLNGNAPIANGRGFVLTLGVTKGSVMVDVYSKTGNLIQLALQDTQDNIKVDPESEIIVLTQPGDNVTCLHLIMKSD